MTRHEVIDIRLGRLADATRMGAMSRDLVESGLGWNWRPARIRRMMRHPDCVVIAAWRGNELVGFAVMEFHAEHAHLNLLAVDPGVRRQGVATALLDWLTESAQVAGIHRIDLEVRRYNRTAIRFYERYGYSVASLIPGYYRGREDALRMTLPLVDGDWRDIQL